MWVQHTIAHCYSGPIACPLTERGSRLDSLLPRSSFLSNDIPCLSGDRGSTTKGWLGKDKGFPKAGVEPSHAQTERPLSKAEVPWSPTGKKPVLPVGQCPWGHLD